MADGERAVRWLDRLAAQDGDAAVAVLVPAEDDAWNEVLLKHQRARDWLGSPKAMNIAPAALCSFHGMMINTAIERGELDYALATFNELAAAAAPLVEQTAIRGFLANGAEDLIHALFRAKRHEEAENVYGMLLDLSDRFHDDEAVSYRLAAAASYMAGSCCLRKDFKRAAAILNDVNHLPPFGERWREIDLLHARGVGTLVVALVEEGDWDNARTLTYLRRELLLWPDYLDDLTKLRGAQFAAAAHELFAAMIERYEELNPLVAPDGREAILDRYDFDRLQTVNPFEFLALRVPARWSRLQKGGSWGYWEEGVEAGTLWVNCQHRDFDCGPDGPSPELLSEMIDQLARDVIDDEERADNVYGGLRATETANGHLLRYYREGDEAGERLVFHVWHLLVPSGTGVVLIRFSLVMLLDLAHRPEFKELAQIMNREIEDARIERDRLPAGR